MQPESATRSEPDKKSPGLSQLEQSVGGGKGAQNAAKEKSAVQNVTGNQFPPPKTDKPRPHVCGTCGRSFARLEHLKRHERSHTKEKPFECPECTRCFARRDLLLRHQQKLHATNPTSSRPRAGRRESVSGTSNAGSAKVRKNSLAGNASNGAGGPGNIHSRRNTISHIDLSSLGLQDSSNLHLSRMNALGIHTGHNMGMHGYDGSMNFDYRGMSNSMGNHGDLHGLPKLDLSSIGHFDNMNSSLRTAPALNSYAGFDLDQLFSSGNTVNPAQLHFGGPTSATSQFPNYEAYMHQHPLIPEGDDFAWMRTWNMQIQPGGDNHEQAVDESSPSHMSSGDSPAGYSENMSHSTPAMPISNGQFQWSQPELELQLQRTNSITGPFHLDVLGTGLPALESPGATVSPSHLNDPTSTAGAYFDHSLLPQSIQQQHLLNNMAAEMSHSQPQGINSLVFAPSSLSNFSSDSPSHSTSSITNSARQSSVTSNSTESITDATRQALLASLAQPSVFGHNHRKYSQPNVSSPLSPGAVRNTAQGPNLPNTADIRRYVDAFIQYAHPHMPIVHIPTLSFDSAEYSSSLRGGAAHVEISQNSIVGGGGCLILAMAAIGALYEYDHPASKELFDAAKKMISLYLEERRKADMSAAVSGQTGGGGSPHTPLWLVHAMLLNVIYGHQCGDKTAADIASTHCAALVSLARAAHLARPPHGSESPDGDERQHNADVDMSEADDTKGDDQVLLPTHDLDIQTQWLRWKTIEERKRTLFAIFILSSLLTTAYNQPPTIMNSEILLDLPCDEDLWTAESAQEWHNRGGLMAAEQNAISFVDALSILLTANQRQGSTYTSSALHSNNPLGALQAEDHSADNDLRPSTFGCLVLINALHNYIWETRTRHHGRQWTPQETESMFSHIEPALNAWQAAWKANDHHKLERPNPFGLGPLSADSIPLLDLAFVRLFVNLGRSKEAFWQRDFDAMANELARGTEIVQHADGAPGDDAEDATTDAKSAAESPENAGRRRASHAQVSASASTRREKHLRKAAFYAADSLTIACSYNTTYADMTAHELPIQSAMCFFDCSQVLAEWACTVQERVGRYLGVLGCDAIDYTMVPAIMLLETEDVELLRKIEIICESLESKRFQQENLLALDMQQMNAGATLNSMHNNVNLSACGYGSKMLRIAAMMLEKAVVWPVTHVMAKALETQAHHMDQRAVDSTTQ
ncbi:hypothetical protein LTR10_001242 [Elasticomyces elasticus]|nr:hypothetical protein LTR10_001242 [Elasticomyces elasticus]KAK4965391.1 hypothetical protein LTR42_012147 [Elasticomyces elasticus]